MLGVDRGAASGRGDGRRAQRSHAPAQVRRQHLLELDQGPHGRLLDARHRRPRRGAESDGDRDRLLVVEQKGRHRAPGAQAVAAGRAAERLHGVAQLAQALRVAPDRPAGHAQALGQLATRPVATPL